MKWRLVPMRSLYLPTQAQWDGLVRLAKRHADGVAVMLSVLGLHSLFPHEYTVRVIVGIGFMILSMEVVRWKSSP